LLQHSRNCAVIAFDRAGELFSGATVTAQGGWHHCDRKGYDVAEISRFWIYISSSIIGLATLTLWLVRCSRQRGKSAT
jgi:hypothetical protein